MHHSSHPVKGRSLLIVLFAVALAACQALPVTYTDPITRAPETALPDWPDGQLFKVDSAASEVRIVVQSSGRLARFGHPHVIGGSAVSGQVVIADRWQDSALALALKVDQLELDRPAWRVAEGFEPELPDGAIEATRENLLSPAVLDAATHPLISIRSLDMVGPMFQPDLTVRITLRGAVRDLTVPVALSIEPDQLVATGRFRLRQSEFGIRPFSALGGALAVSDELLVRFRIVAARVD